MTNSPPVIVCDIDGTIADLTHRLHFINDEHGKLKHPDWDSFFAAVKEDTPIDPVRTIVYALHKFGYDIVYVSGRRDDAQCRRDTRAWLVRHSFPRGELLMRPNGDTRPDDIIKHELYVKYIKPNCNVLLVLDDRDRVVKMWRAEGLTCFQVNEGSF